MSPELTYFLLGSAVSVPVAILAPFGTTRLQKILARRSSSEARRREDVLLRERAEVDEYHRDPARFTQFLIARLVLLNIVWIAGEIVGYAVGAITSGTYSVGGLSGSYVINIDELSNLLSGISSLVTVVILSFTARLGVRTYRIWRRVYSYDEYVRVQETELLQLRSPKNGGSPI